MKLAPNFIIGQKGRKSRPYRLCGLVAVVKVVMHVKQGGGRIWRSQVGANPIPIPHPTNLALFGQYKITLHYIDSISGARTISGGQIGAGGLSPPALLTLTTGWLELRIKANLQTTYLLCSGNVLTVWVFKCGIFPVATALQTELLVRFFRCATSGL